MENHHLSWEKSLKVVIFYSYFDITRGYHEIPSGDGKNPMVEADLLRFQILQETFHHAFRRQFWGNPQWLPWGTNWAMSCLPWHPGWGADPEVFSKPSGLLKRGVLEHPP